MELRELESPVTKGDPDAERPRRPMTLSANIVIFPESTTLMPNKGILFLRPTSLHALAE